LSASVIDGDCLQILQKLGLTPLQAKTYLALAKIGVANVTTISKASNIAREEIYRIIPKLEEIGLVEKIISRPSFCKPLSLKEGLSILIERRKTENVKLQKRTKEIMQNLRKGCFKNTFQDESWQFIITSEQRLFLKRFDAFIQNAEGKMDVITSPQVLEEMAFHHLRSVKDALARGVKMRAITEDNKGEAILRNVSALKKNPSFRLKYLYAPVPATMTIFDDKEANLCISKDIVPSLWSNNPEFVKLTTNYFNDLWNKAKMK
jgi:sugar-specific transcriptional regulator TrmB